LPKLAFMFLTPMAGLQIHPPLSLFFRCLFQCFVYHTCLVHFRFLKKSDPI